jgi:hypothetical protein
VVGRAAPTQRRVCDGRGCRREPNRNFVLRSHQNRTAAEVRFISQVCRSDLRRISQAKSERVRSTWVPATSLLTCPSPPFLSNLSAQLLTGAMDLLRGRSTDLRKVFEGEQSIMDLLPFGPPVQWSAGPESQGTSAKGPKDQRTATPTQTYPAPA